MKQENHKKKMALPLTSFSSSTSKSNQDGETLSSSEPFLPKEPEKEIVANSTALNSSGSPTNAEKDRGYAWIVCLASFISQMMQCGILYSMGMFYILFKKNMQGDSEYVALVSSIHAATCYLTAPVAGFLYSKFGGRIVGIAGSILGATGLALASISTELYQLYLTYGILTGIGMALQYNPCLSMLAVYFERRIGLASGIASSGCGLGSVYFPPLVNILEDNFGWRGALLICSGTQLQSVVCCALFRPLQEKESKCLSEKSLQINLNDNMVEDSCKATTAEHGKIKENAIVGKDKAKCCVGLLNTYCTILRIKEFTTFSISQFFMMISVATVYTHLGAYAKSLGYSDSYASLLYLMIGVTTTAFRFICGGLLQVPRANALVVFSTSHVLLGVLTLLFNFYTTMPLLAFYAIVYGMFTGPFNAYNVPIVSKMVDPELMSSALGLILLFLAPGSLFGPPLAGLLGDRTGVYTYTFYLAGLLMVLSGLITAPLCLQNLRTCKSLDKGQKKV